MKESQRVRPRPAFFEATRLDARALGRRIVARWRPRVALFAALMAAGAGPGVAQQGIIAVEDPRHNFGVVPEGDIVRHVFEIGSMGEVPFTVTGVESSCECVTADWTTDPIAPDEWGEVGVEFDSRGRHGWFEHTLSVESTAAPSPLDLQITGFVEPASLARGDTLGSLVFGGFRSGLPVIRPGDPLAHPIWIKNISSEPIEIREVRPNAEHVTVDVPETVLKPETPVRINVEFDTSEMNPGVFGHRVDIVTSDPDLPIKRILLMGMIREAGVPRRDRPR